ncbi:MAG TPA: histidine kinase [Longimicrobiales bacterium]|nr:histidine kinase [Longimicrobiales bacterium]
MSAPAMSGQVAAGIVSGPAGHELVSGATRLPGTRIAVAIFAFWTLIGAYTAAYWIYSPSGNTVPNPGGHVATAFATAYLWAVLTLVSLQLAARLNPESGQRFMRLAALLMIGVAAGGLVAVVEAVVFTQMLPIQPRVGESWWGRPLDMTRVFLPKETLTSFLVLGVALGTDFSRRYRARQRETIQLQAERSALEARAARLQAQSAELKAQLAEARLTSLRSQLNPHFLFNTLNAISALVTADPRGVQDMIALLSDLLRRALLDAGEQTTTVGEELELTRIYLEILEIRYQGQLRVDVVMDHDVADARVPKLVLQPLVENAVKHGIDRAGGRGTIDVRAFRAGDQLVLTVRDTGPGPGGARPPATGGVGLRLTRERLAELYGSRCALELEPAAGGGMLARIRLPFELPDASDLAVAGA